MAHDTETVIVRDRDGVRQVVVDDWVSMQLLGALSADPRCFDELARAWLRYQPDSPLEDFPWEEGLSGEPDGPWVLLDLACLQVVSGGGAELPENAAAFQNDEGDWAPGIPLVWINVPPAWRWEAGVEWQEALPPTPVPAEPLDVRGILFGRALGEGIAARTLEVARRETLPAELIDWTREADSPPSESQREVASRWYALTVRVHADWLMTPREDLEGETPRHFLHDGRDWVDRELDNRERQWSSEGRAPRPLDCDTFAYRYGPLGRHEVVMYFDLCRVVIRCAWKLIVARPGIDEATLAQALYDEAQTWLAEGSIDDDPTPPAVIIENERRRMPLVGDGSHLDCDCPLCRMGAEAGFGPMFRGFDGHHLALEDEFAFSLCATHEEWEEEQYGFAQFSDDSGEQEEEEEEMDEEEDSDDQLASVWSRSFVNDELLSQEAASSLLPILALAARVSELVSDLKESKADRQLIDALNFGFDALRETAADVRLRVVAAERLVEVLEEVASALPHLTPKAADLQSKLDELLRKMNSDFSF